MADPAAVHLIQMIDAISAATGDTMLTTATASASEDVEAGLGLDLAPDQGAAATVHDPEAAAITGGTVLHLIQNAGAGLALQLAQNRGLLLGVALGHALDLDLPHALAPDPGPTLAALRGAGRFLVSNHIIPAFL